MQARHTLGGAHSDYTSATLPSDIVFSVAQLRKAARKLCDLITSTIDKDSIRTRFEQRSHFDGLQLLRLICARTSSVAPLSYML